MLALKCYNGTKGDLELVECPTDAIYGVLDVAIYGVLDVCMNISSEKGNAYMCSNKKIALKYAYTYAEADTKTQMTDNQCLRMANVPFFGMSELCICDTDGCNFKARSHELPQESSGNTVNPLIVYVTSRLILNTFPKFCGFHTFVFFEGNVMNWVVGEPFKGDCNDICNENYPGSICDKSSFWNLDLQKAKRIIFSKGNECRGWNNWDFGQGFSQCTKSDCCGDGSCQYHCSFPSVASTCVIPDTQEHSRICPCIFGTLFYLIGLFL